MVLKGKKDSCDFDRFLSIVLEKFTPYSMYVKLLLSMKFLRKGAGNYAGNSLR